MKKSLGILVLTLAGILSCNNSKDIENRVGNIKQRQIMQNCYARIKREERMFPESKLNMSCDEKGNVIYDLPSDHSIVKYLNKLEQNRNELEQLIKKYGEKKVINGETVYYWETNLMDFSENPDYDNSFKHVYTLYDNGGIDWEEIQIHFGKECQRIRGTLPNPPSLGVECTSQDPCRGLEERIFRGNYCFFFQRGAVESGLMYDQGKEKRTDPSRTKPIP